MNIERLDLSVKNGRWEWQCVIRKKAVICGMFSYASKKSAKAAALKVLRSLGLSERMT